MSTATACSSPSYQQSIMSFDSIVMPDFDRVASLAPPQQPEKATYECAFDLLLLAASSAEALESQSRSDCESSGIATATSSGTSTPTLAFMPSSPSPSMSSLPSPTLLSSTLKDAAASYSFPLLSQSTSKITTATSINANASETSQGSKKRKSSPSTPLLSSPSSPPSCCSDEESVSSPSTSGPSSKRAKLLLNPAYKCEHCSSFFMRNQDLTRHISSVHEKSVLFTCPGCPGTRFSRKDALKRHIRTFKCCSVDTV
ncbi:hypothetical protein HDU79_006481 [Rhizoclosmatium sp. JEL0117]|nr:hypothetical protein HDU79_006481 [Rhizoclosmatium sp. JEL0117]